MRNAIEKVYFKKYDSSRCPHQELNFAGANYKRFEFQITSSKQLWSTGLEEPTKSDANEKMLNLNDASTRAWRQNAPPQMNNNAWNNAPSGKT